MILILLLILIQVEISSSQSNWCSDSKCTSCLAGYKYRDIKCLSLCPSGFTISGKTCEITSSLTLFSFSPGVPLPFDAKSVEMFYHPAGLELRDSRRQSPIMTKDRGLYFARSSMLVSNTSWILSPELTIVLSIRIIEQGVIFKVSNKNQIFLEISGNKINFEGKVLLSYPSVNKTENLSTIHSDEWIVLVFIVNQNLNDISLSIFGKLYTFSSAEFRLQIQDLTFTLGAPENSSFVGFLYDMYIRNDLSSIRTMYASEILCGFNEYFFNNTCIKCSPSCPEWPWCVRNGCSLCFHTNCTDCTNFQVDSCIGDCFNSGNKCGLLKGCLQGTIYTCSICNSIYLNIKGICVLSPYQYNPTNLLIPVIKTKFIEFNQFYDIFQSGNNASTYSPYNNSEIDDPYPLKSRGMAFHDNKIVFLKTTLPITLSCEFSIALWIISFSSGFSVYKETLKIFSNTRGILELTNDEDITSISTSRFTETAGKWRFIALRLKVDSNMTSIYLKNDLSDAMTNTVKGLAFNDRNTSLYLGNSNKTTFYGIIYSISIWQTFVSDLSSELVPCGVDLGSKCLSECVPAKYYSENFRNCLYCSSECSQGCTSFGRCSSCALLNCTMCSSYENNATCYQNSNNYCIDGLKAGKNGECCHSSCSSCYGTFNYNCYSCSVNFVLVGHACYPSCPLGFVNVSSVCILLNVSTIDVKFDKILKNPISSLFPIQFEVANSSLFYPNFSVFNPIPAQSRGYYFGKKSVVQSSSLNLSYNQTYSIWIKIFGDGNILKRGSFSINTQYIRYLNIFSSLIQKQNTWYRLTAQIFKYIDGKFVVSIKENNNQIYFQYFWDYILMDTSSSIILGDPLSCFQGFIYRLALFNVEATNPVYSESLSQCPFLTFETGNDCINCQASCKSGCINQKSCNLCGDPLCKVCYSFSENYCEECLDMAVMIDGTCTCRNGTYWNQTTWNCEKCPEPCLNCLNTTFCLSCIQDSMINNNWCVCNQGLYFDMNGLKCLNCFTECKTCSGNLQSNCLSCHENASKSNEGMCTCLDGYFMDAGECKKCYGLCLTCSNFTNCYNCKQGMIYEKGTCKCPNGLFANLKLEICISCDAKCKTCSELSGSTCTSCNQNSELINNSCNCIIGFFWDSANSACSPCDSLCEDCLSLSDCKICKENTLIKEGICSCIDGYFKNSNQSCLPCDETCLTCSGPLMTNCLECKNHAVILDDSSCVCLSGYFMDTGDCLRCSRFCIECLDYLKCLDCDHFSYVIDGICKCKDKLFNDGVQEVCQPCNSKCFNCLDKTENSCTSCDSNSYLNGTQCYCKKGFFWNEIKSSCQECDGLCLDCTSVDSCNECKTNSDLFNGTCYCLEGYYRKEPYPTMCEPCSTECFTCFGPSRINCAQCKPKAFLLSSYSCMCFDGYYFDDISSQCQICDDLCKTCSGSKTRCTSCNSEFYLSKESCFCVDGYFLNSTFCQPCHFSCKTCWGPSEKNCFSCNKNAILLSEFACKCIGNYFMKLGRCISCHPTCQTCLEETENNCSSCKTGLIFNNEGQCKCEPPLFWDNHFEACLPCSEFCLNCNSFNLTECDKCSSDCYFCPENSIYTNNSCKCIEGYFERNNFCLKCNEKCKTCNDESFFSCTSCNNSVLLGQFCIDKCPLGYVNRGGVCIMKDSEGEVMRFEFSYFSTVYIDKVFGIKLEPANHLNLSLPVPVYGQGLYFNGMNSGMMIRSTEQKNRLFSDEFLLSFWIRSYANAGALIRSSSVASNLTEVSFSFDEEGLSLFLFIANNLTEVKSNQTVPLEVWTLVAVSLSHSSPTSASFFINLDKKTFWSISEEPFISQDDNKILLGFDSEKQTSFQGFLYKIDLRRNASSSNLMVSSNCQGCSLCLIGRECMSTCSINHYFDKYSQFCKLCMSECGSGCRHSSTCGMCFDSECLNCLDFNSGSCTQCKAGYQLSSGICKKCEGTVFYNVSSKLCEGCKGLCVTCLSEFECLSCDANAEVQNKTCICSLGYYLNETYCERVLFGSVIKISLDNSAQIVFTEPLGKELTTEDVQVFYNAEPCKFKIWAENQSITSVQCKITWNVRLGSSIRIEFLRPVTSIYNSLLIPKNLTIGLFPNNIEDYEVKIQRSKDIAEKGTTVGASVSLCLSVASFDVSSLFSFVNFAEIFSVISLYGLELEDDLLEFLRSVRVQKSLPNVFDRFSENSLQIDLNDNLVKYGYKSNSAIINSGVSILIFLIILFCFFLTNITIPLFHQKVPKLIVIQEYFHYEIFLKFWIQTCLDLLITSLNALFHGYFKRLFYFADYCCSVIIIILQFVLFLITLVLIKKRQKLETIEEIQKFDKKFGALFKEFDSDDYINLYFYPLFFVRRIAVSMAIFLIQVPILRLTFSFIFSLMNLCYLLETRCFISKINNLLHISNEVLTGFLHITIIIALVKNKNDFKFNATDICINIITLAWALNIVCTIAKIVSLGIEKYRKYRNKKKVEALKVTSMTSKNDQIFVKNIDIEQAAIETEGKKSII